MKERLTSNLGIKLLSLLLAVILWGVIINIDDPYQQRSFYGMEVELLNTEGITSQNQVYEILEGASVDIRVSARRALVNDLNAADFKVTADFSELYHDIVPIRVECKRSNVEILSQSLDYVKISLDEITTKQFFVKLAQEGELADGHVISEVLAQPSSIQITGAKSKLDQISSVRCVLNVNNVSEDFTVALEPRICDEDMNYLSKEGLKLSASSINVTAKVQQSKSVKVNIVTEGVPVAGYAVSDIVFEPDYVEVAGSEKALANFSQINVSVDVTGQTETIEKILSLAEYIPEGIRLVDNNADVNVRIDMEMKETKDVQILPDTITVHGLAEGMEYQLMAVDNLSVSLFGLSKDLDMVVSDNLNPYVDLTGLEAGIHPLKIQVETLEGVEVLSSPMVTVQLYFTDESGGIIDQPTEGE